MCEGSWRKCHTGLRVDACQVWEGQGKLAGDPDAFLWKRIGTVSNVQHQLDAEQKLEQARIFKEKGTKHFKVYLVFPSFPLCYRCANVYWWDSDYLLMSLQDQKYEIASSRYQKVIFLESAGYLITWGVEEKTKVWLDDGLRWLISLSTRSPWKGRQKTSARLCCRWAARITLAHHIYMLTYAIS